MATNDLTAQRLRELFIYDPMTGLLHHRKAWGRRSAGAPVQGANLDGYVIVRIDGQTQRVHRLAILYSTGELPPFDVDHIDGDKTNNRLCNLRPVTRTENNQNRRVAQRNNRAGFLGLNKMPGSERWRARINGKHLGTYESFELAQEAYLAAKRALHSHCSI